MYVQPNTGYGFFGLGRRQLTLDFVSSLSHSVKIDVWPQDQESAVRHKRIGLFGRRRATAVGRHVDRTWIMVRLGVRCDGTLRRWKRRSASATVVLEGNRCINNMYYSIGSSLAASSFAVASFASMSVSSSCINSSSVVLSPAGCSSAGDASLA